MTKENKRFLTDVVAFLKDRITPLADKVKVVRQKALLHRSGTPKMIDPDRKPQTAQV